MCCLTYVHNTTYTLSLLFCPIDSWHGRCPYHKKILGFLQQLLPNPPPCMQPDLPSDVNTPERGGGDPTSDGNTLVERTDSNQHNDLGEVIIPCRDKHDAGLGWFGLDDLPIYWESRPVRF